MSIKLKVVLWYAVLMVALVVAVLAFIFYVGLKLEESDNKNNLINSVKEAADELVDDDDDKRHKSKEKSKKFDDDNEHDYDDDDSEASSFQEIEYFDDDVYLLIYDKNMQLLFGRLPSLLTQESIPPHLNDELQTVTVEDTRWLLYDHEIVIENYDGAFIRGFMLLDSGKSAMNNLLTLAAVALPFLVVLALAGGYLITRRAFRPVKQMTETAEQITNDSDFSRRIGLSNGKDEIFTLAKTFDKMLDRLEMAFENEKQFTSDASHELRTPTSVIISQCEYSIENAKTLDEAKEALNAVLEQASRMSALITQMLMLARADKGHKKLNMESLDIAELCSMVVEERRASAEQRGMTIETRLSSNVMVNADETMMIRMFINLIDNAVTYGKAGGRIEIGITQDGADMAVGYISDDGIGISERDLPHIWERFYRADKSRSSVNAGMGLGLSMVKWIIDAHGGTIIARSKLDIGTTFIFTLPLALSN